jgi:cation transport ATPase
MLSGGAGLEQYAARHSSSVLAALARRMPEIAHRVSNAKIEDLSIDKVAIGDTLIVFPHEICPVDGAVVEGQGVMDEAYLTGEPFVISKAPGSQVLSGAVNGDTALTIVASRLPEESRYAKIEQVDRCRTLIFDKTGTLTYGRPALTEIICAPGFEKDAVLRAAASLERYSKHPLAGAILKAAEESHLALGSVTQVAERAGQGLVGAMDQCAVQITGRSRIDSGGVELPPMAGGLECVVLIDEKYAALFRFRDAPRRDSSPFVRHLGPSHQVDKVMLVSGDRESEVRYLAESVGISEVHFGKSPEEKLSIVKEEAGRAKTLFVGDGINDAPALLAATVGVAFGQGSDVTSEAADAVILESSLGKVDELIHIGRRMRSIALQSAIGGLGLSVLGMLLAALGYLPPVSGAIAQEIIDLASVLNALRIVIPFGELTDF